MQQHGLILFVLSASVFIGASGFQASLFEISLSPGVDAFCFVDLLFILGTILNSSLLLSVLKGF